MLQLLKFLHVVSVVIWVGGMFFAYIALRPAAAQLLEPPARLKLWEGTFRRFFLWVWIAVALILGSGIGMILRMGGFGRVPLHIFVMFILGLIMTLIFAYVFFAPYHQLKRGVSGEDWKSTGAALARIRVLVGVNLLLGLSTIAVAILGPLIS